MSEHTNPGQSETVTVVVRREDACAVAFGPLDYTMRVKAGEVPDGGSPMRVRQALLNAVYPRSNP